MKKQIITLPMIRSLESTADEFDIRYDAITNFMASMNIREANDKDTQRTKDFVQKFDDVYTTLAEAQDTLDEARRELQDAIADAYTLRWMQCNDK